MLKNLLFDKEIPTEKRREKIINILLKRYNFLEKRIISQSLLGREILILHIGTKQKSIFFSAAYHGMEWLTSLVLLKFINDICERAKNSKKFLDFFYKRGITICPCVNPDGVEISLVGASAAGGYKAFVKSTKKAKFWQANARGVDINHNFDAQWEDLHKREQMSGIKGPDSTRYGGDKPESEPETRAITKLCREMNFDYAVAFHSQGEEIYWNYGEKVPVKSREIAEKMAKISGYKLAVPTGLASGGGFKDWFIGEFEKPGFTVEIGKGKNPLPLTDFRQVYKKVESMLYFLTFYRST